MDGVGILRLDQARETPLTAVSHGPFKLRYAYIRSKDCQLSGEDGQDYLTCRVRSFRAAFVLCDGVGQSFLGGIGASIVGEALLKWLWNQPSDNESVTREAAARAGQLQEFLNSKTAEATELIKAIDLSAISSVYMRDALESRREERGTQSNFVCGLIDTPNESLAQGRILLFWLGDAKLQIWHKNTNQTHRLMATWNSREAWSSLFGTYGPIHGFEAGLDEIDCIIAHSDGADPIQATLAPGMSSDELADRLTALEDDDVSYLEIQVPGIPARVEEGQETELASDAASAIPDVRIVGNGLPSNQGKAIQEPKIGKKRPIPIWPYVVCAAAVGLLILIWAVFAYIFGRNTLPLPVVTAPPLTASLPREAIETPSQVLAMAEPSMSLPPSEVAPTSINTAHAGEGVVLDAAGQFTPLQPGCHSIAQFYPTDRSSVMILVQGPFQVTGYEGRDCQGSVVVAFPHGALEPIGGVVQSIMVDSLRNTPAP